MIAAGVFALVASLSLYGQDAWLLKELTKSNNKKQPKDRLNAHELQQHVASTQKGLLISAIVVLFILSLVAWSVYRGRYWSRWAVLGVWALGSFTGTVVGIGSILAIGATSIPLAYRLPAFVSAVLLLVAVVMVMLPTSAVFFALNRPARPAGPSTRRGMFAGLGGGASPGRGRTAPAAAAAPAAGPPRRHRRPPGPNPPSTARTRRSVPPSRARHRWPRAQTSPAVAPKRASRAAAITERAERARDR